MTVGYDERWIGAPGRALRAELWYPARQVAAPPIHYLRERDLLDALDGFYAAADSGRGWRLDRSHAGELRVAAFAAAPPAPGSHPVVLFSHGRAASALQNTTRVSDLASHGYVVVALEHPRTSLRSPLPGGGGLAFDPSLDDGDRIERAWADLSLALDRLTALEAQDPLARIFDLGRVGALGRAFGGSVVVLGASRDPRIRAVASLGGDPPATALVAPLLQMNSATAPERGGDLCIATKGPAWQLVVAGTGSTSYSDTPYLPWLVPPPASAVGTIDRSRAALIIGTCVAAFFDEQLGRTAGALERAAGSFPEVAVTRRS